MFSHYELHIDKWIGTRRIVRCAWEHLPLWVDLLVVRTMVSLEYFQFENNFMFAIKFDSVFPELRNKWKICGRLFRELPRTIESCKAGCLFFTSFNEYIHLTVSSEWYLAIFYKVWSWTSMRSGRKEKLNKTDVRVYGPTLKCLTLPPRFNVSP